MKNIKPINNEDDICRESLANTSSTQNPHTEENRHINTEYSNTLAHQNTNPDPRLASKEPLDPRDMTKADIKKLNLLPS